MTHIDSRYLQASDLFAHLSKNVYHFIDALGYTDTITPQQTQMFDSVMRGERRIAIKSGQGTGKDW